MSSTAVIDLEDITGDMTCMVLRQIVQYIIPAVLKARSIRTAEDRETRTGIAFKNEKRKKYKNIACLGDKTQNRIQSSEDCKVV